MTRKSLISTIFSGLLLINYLPVTTAEATPVVKQVMSQQSESKKANTFFEETFMRDVKRSPQTQTAMGMKTNYDQWNENSEARDLEDLNLAKSDLANLLKFNYSQLDKNTQVSFDLLKQSLEQTIEDYQWRYHTYPVNQMYGTHAMVPAFLINQHRIDDVSDARAYIARLNGVPKVFDQLIVSLKTRAEKGIIVPKFVFPLVIDSSKNIIKGAPFESADDSTLLADFKKKVNELTITNAEKDGLIKEANASLLNSVKPAYENLITYLISLEKLTDEKDGVWKLPDGNAFYDNALNRTTTTNLTADKIHQIGLNEVKRIHQEMSEIKQKVGFKGDLKAFMHFMKTDPQFYLPETEAGREQYLSTAISVIDDMKSRLDELFIVKPKADLEVKRVEAFREKSAGKAFYQAPAEDGSRPGKYYANLYNMSAMPTYQLEALAYHEGIPGHHMQRSIALELDTVPKFRKYASYTAYTEGWGLYSETIPKEMGLYSDPYSDFGRLAMELWRACRLVVDTGIHKMKWTRQQGIDYYVANTPNATSDAVKMVERHIIMPSQATAYKIGMIKILDIRERAKKQLGEKFDIRQFHDAVLKNGAVPLNVVEKFVDEWIASKG